MRRVLVKYTLKVIGERKDLVVSGVESLGSATGGFLCL
jgi:hypothetical protein